MRPVHGGPGCALGSIRARERRASTLALALAAALLGCGGGGGAADGGGGGEPPPGGSGIGAGGTPIFWRVFGYGVLAGALEAVEPTADGGFVGAGYQASGDGGTPDLYVVKTDGVGVAQWERRIPFSGGARGHAVRELAGGGYLVAGACALASKETPFLLRLTADGAMVVGWPKLYGGDASGAANALLAAGGGADGFLAVGYRAAAGDGPRAWVLRTDAGGTVLWERSDYEHFCPGGGERGSGVAEAPGGGWVVAGTTGCFGWSSFLLRISGADGAEAWRRAYDPSDYTAEAALSVAPRPGGGFFLAGWHAAAPDAPRDALVLATDAAGDELWRRTFGGAELDAANAVAATADGFVAAGVTRSYGGAIGDPTQPFQWEDLLLVRGSASGQVAWRKVKGLRPRGSDVASAVRTLPDGGFVVGGSCGGNVLLARVDSGGDTVSLGDRDLSYVVPATEGTVRLGNAAAVARAAAIGLTRPGTVGGTVLDLLAAALRGDPPGDFCSGGGAYAFAPSPVHPVAPGDRFVLTVSACVVSEPGGSSRLDGSATVDVEAGDGDPRTSAYGLAVAVTGLSVETVTLPDAISSAYAGALRFERTATGAGRSEVARSVEVPAPVALVETETEGNSTRTVAVGPFTVTGAADAAGALACGAATDALAVDPGLGPLEVTVLAPLAFAAAGADPSAGAFRVVAPDGSTLTARVAGPGLVEIAVDTDGDGAEEGALSTTWDELD